MTAIFDCRLDPSIDHNEFEAMIKKWCEEAGSDVTYSFEQKNPKVENTKLDDSNPFWIAFKKACDDLAIQLQVGIFPGGTDSRYIRQVIILYFYKLFLNTFFLRIVFYFRLEFLLLVFHP